MDELELTERVDTFLHRLLTTEGRKRPASEGGDGGKLTSANQVRPNLCPNQHTPGRTNGVPSPVE
jgi:hypothetical protein